MAELKYYADNSGNYHIDNNNDYFIANAVYDETPLSFIFKAH